MLIWRSFETAEWFNWLKRLGAAGWRRGAGDGSHLRLVGMGFARVGGVGCVSSMCSDM